MSSASHDPDLMRCRALTRAAPEQVWRAFADPARLPEWFSGARDVEASVDYPAVGSHLRWRVGRWRFEAEVVASEPPLLLRQRVRTPSAASTVTHRVVREGDDVHYEKTVEASWNGWLERFLARGFVARSIVREVERVARAAERT